MRVLLLLPFIGLLWPPFYRSELPQAGGKAKGAHLDERGLGGAGPARMIAYHSALKQGRLSVRSVVAA